MNKADLAICIRDVSYLTGHFILRSGKTSTFYWDKYRFESDPPLLAAIVEELQKLLPPSFDKVAGLELGGVPLATGLSLKVGKPCLYVRKQAKEYGTCKLAEGTDINNKQVCIIEDVVTTGGQVVLSAADLKQFGARVKYVLCVIERDSSSRDNLGKEGLELLSLFTMEELKQYED